MNTKPDGGPAYPQIDFVDGAGTHYIRGMTIRDHFAGIALQGMLSQSSSGLFDATKSFTDFAAREKCDFGECIVGLAYEVADAMIEAREK